MMRFALLSAALGVVAALLLAGCNYAVGIAYLIEGPGKIPPAFVLPPERSTVVFVDDRANTIATSGQALRRTIADRVTTDLLTREIVATMIDSRDAMAFVAANDRHSTPLPMDAIGREVGAEVVIYVEMAMFTESPDGVTPRPTAQCRVRVIDVAARSRLFPPNEGTQASWPVEAVLREVDPALFRSQSSRLKILQLLAEETGDQIAKLFYEHERVDLGEHLEPR